MAGGAVGVCTREPGTDLTAPRYAWYKPDPVVMCSLDDAPKSEQTMTDLTATVTLYLTPAQMPRAMAGLIAFCVRAPYAFLQTWHSADHSDVDIFTPSHTIQLTLCTAVSDGPEPGSTLFSPEVTTSTELAHLAQQLVQICTLDD
jgi:hypothetical protein